MSIVIEPIIGRLHKHIGRLAEIARDADARAQRAEALLRRARPILAGQQRVSWQLVDDMDAALATPPPEGGSESWAGTWDEQADVPLCDWKPGMRNTPEQAHGDALAAFDRLCNWFDIPGDDDAKIPEAAYLDYQQVRRHLTASGVPEEVRRMPELFRGRARCNQQHPGHTFRSEVYEQCADELESALASAPADGWKLVPVEPTEAMIRIGKGVNPPWSVRCATPVYRAMIAAAPMDGRE